MITLNSHIYLIECKISACQWRQTDAVIKRKHEKKHKSEACLWWAIQDNKKYQEKKIEVLPIAMETESN